jgi:hypothetical protein
LWPSGSWEEGFQMAQTYFCIFVIISHLKRNRPFIWTNLNSLYPKMICTKFDWNWLVGSEEVDFKTFSVFFLSFAKSFLGEGVSTLFDKLGSPLPKDLWQVWLKLAQWFWRRSWNREKFTDRGTDGQKHNGQQAIRKASLSFQLRWAENDKKFLKNSDALLCKGTWRQSHL